MKQLLLPFEDFLSYLQQQGFALGVDDFLQIQTLLNRLPKDCPPEKMKSLMCPLLVSNETEQELFYQAFDHYFADLTLQQAKIAKETPPSHSPLQKADEELEKYHKYGEELEWSVKGFFYQKFQTIVVGVLVLLLVMGAGFVYFNMQEEEIKETSIEEVSDSTSNDSYKPNHQNIVTENVDSTSSNSFTSPSKESLDFSNTSKKEIPQKSENKSIGFLEFVCWLLLIFAVWMFILHFKVRRDFYLEALENIEPPQYWNIQVPKSELNLARSQAFKHAANRLQKRRRIPTKKVDILQTVEATIIAAGFPNFKYLQTSALPEYLLLIDQSSTKDQQTKWFDRWFEALKEREVLVHRFFYHDNPEWCWDEGQNYVSLVELYHQFGECRLVLIPPPLSPSEGEGKLSVISPPLEGIKGRLDWGSVFTDWQEKVLLSPTPLSKSVVEYLEKESGFIILPAKIESLHQLSDIFEGEGAITAKAGSYPSVITTDLDKLSVSEAVAELKRTLTKVGFDCLCAAAVYPEMNWDLTVYLGETLFDERELLKESNMLPLVSLPYFRKGFMPENLRRALIEELDEDSKRLVKGAILHLLQLHPLVDDEYSAEFFDYQLHIALQDAQLHAHDQHKLSTLKYLVEQKQFEESRYKQVVLRYLETRDEDGLSLGEMFGKWFKKEDEIVETEVEEKPSVVENSIEKEGEGLYIYPKVANRKRLKAMGIDAFKTVCYSLVVLLCLMCFPFLLNDYITKTILVLFWGATTWWVFVSMDIREGNVGLGKASTRLMVIDVKTNTNAEQWKKIMRRSIDIVLVCLLISFVFTSYKYTLISSFWGVILLTIGIVWSGVVHESGRRLVDFLLETQVVNQRDFDKKNWKRKPMDFKNTYIYPRADNGNRTGVAAFDGSMSLFWVFVASVFIYFFIGDVYLSIWIGLLLRGSFWIVMESWNDNTGLKEDIHTRLIIIDIQTNERAKLWKRFARRAIDFLILLFFYEKLYPISLENAAYLLVFTTYITMSLISAFISKGCRLGDVLLGTQVVNMSDFKAKNYRVEKMKKEHTV